MVNRKAVLALSLTAAGLLALLAHLQVKDTKSQQALVLKDADTVNQIEVFAPVAANNNRSQETHSSNPDNAPDWILTREGESWSIQVAESPASKSSTEQSHTTTEAAVQADKNRVAPLLALLQLPDRQAYAITEVDLRELGLEPPQAVVTLDQLNFSFGHLSVDGSARYVRVNDTVHLYQEFAFPLISAGANAFVQQDSDAAVLK